MGFAPGGEGFRSRENTPRQESGNLDFGNIQEVRGARDQRLSGMRQRFSGPQMPHRAPNSPNIAIPAMRANPRFAQMQNRFQKKLDHFGERPNFRDRVQPRLNHYGYRPAREYYGRGPRPEFRSGYRQNLGAYQGRFDAQRRIDNGYRTIAKYHRLGATGLGHQHFANKAMAESLGIDRSAPRLSGTDVAFQSHVLRLEQQKIIDEQRALNQRLERQRAETNDRTNRVLGLNRNASAPRTDTVSGVFRHSNRPPLRANPAPTNTPPTKGETPQPEVPKAEAPKAERQNAPDIPKPEIGGIAPDDKSGDNLIDDKVIMKEAEENGFEFTTVSRKGANLGVMFIEQSTAAVPNSTSGSIRFFIRKNAAGEPAIVGLDEYTRNAAGETVRSPKNSAAIDAVLKRFEGKKIAQGTFSELRDALDAARNPGNRNFLRERTIARNRFAEIERTLKSEVAASGLKNELFPDQLIARIQQGEVMWSINGTLPDGTRVHIDVTQKGDGLKILGNVSSDTTRGRTVTLDGKYFQFENNKLNPINGGLGKALEELKTESARPAPPKPRPEIESRPPLEGESVDGARAQDLLRNLREIINDGLSLDPESAAEKIETNANIDELVATALRAVETNSTEMASRLASAVNYLVRDLLNDTNCSPEQRVTLENLNTRLRERVTAREEEDRRKRTV